MVSHLRIGRYPRPASVEDNDVIGLWRSHFRDEGPVTTTTGLTEPPTPGPDVVFGAAITNNSLIVAQVGSDVVLDCLVATRNLQDHEPVHTFSSFLGSIVWISFTHQSTFC